MDFLGLRTLTVIQDTVDLVKQNRGIDVKFDREEYKILCEKDVLAVIE